MRLTAVPSDLRDWTLVRVAFMMKIILSLLAAAALSAPGGARADSGPTIAARTHNTVSYKSYDDNIHLASSYGEDITVLCTASHAAYLAFDNQTEQLPTEAYNSTTIQVFIKKLEVGKHKYDCTDSRTGHTQSLMITVDPAIKVTSPNIRSTKYSHKTLYFVPRGEEYDVSCSANDLESLSLELFSDDLKELQIKVINETVFAVNETEGMRYLCRKDDMIKFFDVFVDYSPEAQEFQCELHLRRKLECTWTSLSGRNTFKLFYMDQLLCTDMSGNNHGGCQRAWNNAIDDAYAFSPITEHISVKLEVCNEVYCENQTFSIKIKNIIKIDPVYNLQVKYTISETSVEWRHRDLLCYRQCEFKVEYRVAGEHWREAVTRVESYDVSGGVWNRSPLVLPCPDTKYEVRVYVKALSATDRFWSEPASVVYVTPPRSKDTHDAACEEFRRQEPSPDAATLLQEALELVQELNLSQNQKLAEIEALLNNKP